MIERDLNRRHIRALLYLYRFAPRPPLRRYLARVIGHNSRNTIKSLEERGLIELEKGQFYALTDDGRDTVKLLMSEFGITEQFTIEQAS